MRQQELGASGVKVSAVTMGCWAIVGDATWGPQDEAASIATIRAALDAGVTTFDTAEGYGDGYSERLLAKGLAGRRGEVVIASKVSAAHLAPADLVSACERSLRNLDTDYIDLYQIHWPSRTIPLGDSMRTLEDLRRAGKVRAIGVSNFAVLDLDDLAVAGKAVSDQLPYNMLFRAIEYDIAPRCVERVMGILCYCPLAQGLLTGKFASADDVPAGRARTRHFSSARSGTRHGEEGHEKETFAAIARIGRLAASLGEPMERVALAWLLRQPGVATVIAGARSPEQVRDNAAAAALDLSNDTVAELSAATEALKRAMGPNPDMWQAAGQSRLR
jgi:myo-inositol catabolism protein IolS